MRAFSLSVLAFVSAAPLAAQATPNPVQPSASINQRQAHQDARVAQGVASGALTGREVVSLERSENRIEATEARMRADGGGLSRRERVRLQGALNYQSKALYRQKRDAQIRTRGGI